MLRAISKSFLMSGGQASVLYLIQGGGGGGGGRCARHQEAIGTIPGCRRTRFKRALPTYRQQIPVNLPKAVRRQEILSSRTRLHCWGGGRWRRTSRSHWQICEDVISRLEDWSFSHVLTMTHQSGANSDGGQEVEMENKSMDLDVEGWNPLFTA